MAASSADAPPLGIVIQNDDGSHSIWNGKLWAPAMRDNGGNWRMDNAKLSSMGMGTSAGPAGSATEQKTVADMDAAARTMDNVTRTAGDFSQRNARTGTGMLMAVPGASFVAKALGANGDDLAAMDRDSVNMATGLRAPGMRMTQMEFQKFLGSSPSVTNSKGNNDQLVHAMQTANPLAQAQASFYATYLQTHRTLAGVLPAWLNWRNQNFSSDGTYTPANPKNSANAALKARSAQARGPAVIDINGNPVPQ